MSWGGPAFGSQEERLESRQRLSIEQWWVADDYRIEGGIVRPLSQGETIWCNDLPPKGATFYSPMGREELPAELAKAADEREESLLAFVRRYGLLGQFQSAEATGMLRLPRPETPADAPAVAIARRLVAQIVVDHRKHERWLEETIRGDSVAWIFAHARTVRLVLELAHTLSDSDEGRLAAVLSRVRDSDGVFRVWSAHGAGYGTRQLSERYLGRTPREQTLMLMVALVNSNLQLTHSGLYLNLDEGRLHHAIEAPSLVGYVYQHLANAVVGDRVRQCAYPRCRRLFVAADERMKYCPPPLGTSGVSPCMNRSKVAQARVRKRANSQARKKRKVQR